METSSPRQTFSSLIWADEYWGTDAYFGDYPCIDDEVLDPIIAGGYKGIGFDVIGLDPIADSEPNAPQEALLFLRHREYRESQESGLFCGDDLFGLVAP